MKLVFRVLVAILRVLWFLKLSWNVYKINLQRINLLCRILVLVVLVSLVRIFWRLNRLNVSTSSMTISNLQMMLRSKCMS